MIENVRVTDPNRFEVIDVRPDGVGRTYVACDCQIELSYQDGGKTLKVFVRDRVT